MTKSTLKKINDPMQDWLTFTFAYLMSQNIYYFCTHGTLCTPLHSQHAQYARFNLNKFFAVACKTTKWNDQIWSPVWRMSTQDA